MPTSATATRPSPSAQGFTLLELLVVVAIVALIAARAALSLGGIAGPRPQAALHELADRIALIHEEAMLSGRTLGLRQSTSGLEFVALSLDAETRRAVWTPLAGDRLFAPARFEAPYSLTLEVEGAKTKPSEGSPAVILQPDGDLTPFRITLEAPGAPLGRLIGAEDGTLRIEGGER